MSRLLRPVCCAFSFRRSDSERGRQGAGKAPACGSLTHRAYKAKQGMLRVIVLSSEKISMDVMGQQFTAYFSSKANKDDGTKLPYDVDVTFLVFAGANHQGSRVVYEFTKLQNRKTAEAREAKMSTDQIEYHDGTGVSVDNQKTSFHYNTFTGVRAGDSVEAEMILVPPEEGQADKEFRVKITLKKKGSGSIVTSFEAPAPTWLGKSSNKALSGWVKMGNTTP